MALPSQLPEVLGGSCVRCSGQGGSCVFPGSIQPALISVRSIMNACRLMHQVQRLGAEFTTLPARKAAQSRRAQRLSTPSRKVRWCCLLQVNQRYRSCWRPRRPAPAWRRRRGGTV